MITVEGIRATGMYLLEILKSEELVRYSRFYNAAAGTDENLAAGAMPYVADPESCDVEDLQEEGHVMLEFAAWQLEDLGIVHITFLGETLIDGEPDFQIAITQKGAQIAAEGLEFGFRSARYCITATPASEWLINLLEAGGEGLEFTLRVVMELGQSDGDVAINDDSGNTYRLGTRTYAFAFEVSLWHHAKAGHIEPVLKTAEQGKLWSDFVGQTNRPDSPDLNVPRPLWEIPFRLAGSFWAGEVQISYVGKIEAGL